MNSHDLQQIADLLDQKLEEKLEEKLEQKLEEKLDQKLEEKLEQKLEEKLEQKLEEKLEQKLEEKLELKLEPIQKKLTIHDKALRAIRKDQKVILNLLDNEQMRQRKRIDRIEKHLQLPPLPAPKN